MPAGTAKPKTNNNVIPVKTGIQCQKIGNNLYLIFRNKCFSFNLMLSAMFNALDSRFHGNDVS
jgi:hypothetical protein